MTVTIVGIDIGGTFTDFALLDHSGRIRIHKRLTTPSDPARAVLDGLADLAAPPDAVVVHGSTIATNALLERKGARTALVTTRGFADVIEIGRQNRPQLYALEPVKLEPLVARDLRFEVDERVAADGSALTPLDPAEVHALVPKLLEARVESVAVCFLFSFLRPEHERTARNILSPVLPYVSISSDILPEYREYERVSTTVINAYVAPLMARYLERLASGLGGRRLRIMQSNGGVISAAAASAQAARAALSGPAGGIVGAFDAAQRAGLVRAITFDMGGTSTDVALCDGGLPTTTEGEIAGLPLRLPIMDIHTVGAGGGSIARIDAGGALTVGPDSAGADPGPACYGRGGRLPTVTDANLVLGRLDAGHFLGGQMRLDMEAARRAITSLITEQGSVISDQSSVASDQSPVASDQLSAAWGIIRVANAVMERAIRKISVERGHDPRRFTLVAFGGAGPLHACELAESLGIPAVLVPPSPGVLSALGMATANTVKDYSQAVLKRVDAIEAAELEGWFEPLSARGRADLLAEGIAEVDISLRRALDLRYAGQSYEITVEEDEFTAETHGAQRVVVHKTLGGVGGSAVRVFVEAFHRLHQARYGHSHADQPVEIVTARVKAVGRTRRTEAAREPEGMEEASGAIAGAQLVWFEGGAQDTTLFERERLAAGNVVRGPAIIFQFDATTVVPPGWQARVDGWRNLLIVREDA